MGKAGQQKQDTERTRDTDRYSEVLLTYYDILGFRKIVQDRDPTSIYEILRTIRVLNKIGDDVFEGKTFAFSDTLIRSYRVNSTTPLPNLFIFEVRNIALAQAVLVGAGVLVRGCVTIGEAYSRGNTVFGPALIRAYEIAEKVATYPRVVLDPDLLRRVKKDTALGIGSQDPMCELNRGLKEDSDGTYYIDYLWMHPRMKLGPSIPSLLEEHRDLIIKGASENRLLDRISAKYNWLAHYHNSTLRDLEDTVFATLGTTREECLVPLDKIAAAFNPKAPG